MQGTTRGGDQAEGGAAVGRAAQLATAAHVRKSRRAAGGATARGTVPEVQLQRGL